jgi:RNA polymerase sporulation-specific sigma factor
MTAGEVAESLRSLTARQKAILMKLARDNEGKTGAAYSAGDLIQEAFSRVLEGKRTWRRGLPAEIFLGGVIRSIASEWRWKGRAERPIEDDDDFNDGGADARGAEARIDLPRIVRLFEDDTTAQKIIEAMMDGLQGEDIENACGIYGQAYQSKRRKIRRRVLSFTQGGGLEP